MVLALGVQQQKGEGRDGQKLGAVLPHTCVCRTCTAFASADSLCSTACSTVASSGSTGSWGRYLTAGSAGTAGTAGSAGARSCDLEELLNKAWLQAHNCIT